MHPRNHHTETFHLLVAIGMTFFAGQFLLLFFAYLAGLPPGLAAVTQQMKVFFTVSLAAVLFRDIPTRRQSIGMLITFFGLTIIALTVGGGLTVSRLALAIAAAFSWAIGNVLLSRSGRTPMLALVTWLSLIPPLPALLVSSFDRQAPSIITAVSHASSVSIAAVIYLAVFATTIAYAIWGYLLTRHPSADVAPFARLAPLTGIGSSALIFGEVFSLVRYIGMALILVGLSFTLFP